MPAVDVLICTYERPDPVMHVVADVLLQLGADDRVWVYDQSQSQGATVAAIAELGDARCVHQSGPARGLPNARNAALTLGERPLVLFFDDDVRLEPGCIEAHRRALSQPSVGASVGRVDDRGMRYNLRKTGNRVSASGRVRVNLSGAEPADVQSVHGCNMGFRRSILQSVGGFDPGFGGTALLEEADVAERVRKAGWTIRYAPDAALVHLAIGSGGVRVGTAEATERWRFHNTGRFMAKHRGVRGIARAVPTFAAIAAKRGAQWSDPTAPLRLMTAFWTGVFGAGR
ncbi:MAG: glycosyltransferase family 2 protein [Myxococcota bacterium]